MNQGPITSKASLSTLILTMSLLVASTAASAATLHVPMQFATVGGALGASAPGDTVRVAAGTYSPSQNLEVFPIIVPADVVLLGEGMESTILDAEQSGTALQFIAGAPVVRGLMVTGGSDDWGGGAQVLGGTPEIAECYFYRNQALRRGSGINVQGTSAPWIHHNVVWESFDTDLAHGGDPHGIQFVDDSVGIVEHNLVGRGDSNGLLVGGNAAPTIRHNIFFENGIEGVRGRGICALGSPATVISHNLFFGNKIAALIVPNPSAPGFLNLSGAAASALDPADSVYGNIDGDPQLVSPGLMIFQLMSTSPAIDAGDPSLGLDPDGTVLDLGPYYYPSVVSTAPAVGRIVSAVSNYPNPFNPRTTIRFELAQKSSVHIVIVDLSGRRVRTLLRRTLEGGYHELAWDGTDDASRPVASGVYVARVSSADEHLARPMTLVR